MLILASPDMARRRAEAEALIDYRLAAEMDRAAGLDGLYRRKVIEAESVRQGPGPLIAAEMAVRGISAEAVAASILKRAAEADSALAAIEARRLAAKQAVRQAATPAAIEAVLATLDTLTPHNGG